MSQSDPTPKLPVPLWREPIMIGIVSFVILGCAAVLLQGQFTKQKPVDPNNPIANGGTFCDPPTPVQTTAYNPSTRKNAE